MGTQQSGSTNICPNCGSTLSGATRYCQHCGAALDPTRAEAGRVPPPSTFLIAGPRATPQPQPPPVPNYQYGYGYGYPPPPPRARRTATIGIIAGVAVLGCVGFFVAMVAMGMQNFTQVREKAKEAETKANLHNIQLSVERYAVDHDNSYPPYLIGGEGRYTDSPVPLSAAPVLDCPDTAQLSDPLLRAGYFSAYPRNPFVNAADTTMFGVHAAQMMPMMVKPEARGGPDPLSNGAPEGKTYGTRFGARCDVMGQVLCEPRYPVWADPARPTLLHDSFANIGYQMWDLKAEAASFEFLSGEFFYKSAGLLTAARAAAVGYGVQQPLRPEYADTYMLGAYGGMRTKGKDIIGDERALTGFKLPSGKPAPPVWPWTRSTDSPDPAGSPYSAALDGPELLFGNPNGIRDGIVLVLTTGEVGTAGVQP